MAKYVALESDAWVLLVIPSLAVGLCTTYFTSLCLAFPICKMEIIIAPGSKSFLEVKYINKYIILKTVPGT